MATITISTSNKKTTAKKKATKKSSTLSTAKSVTSLASNVLTVDKKLRDSKNARAKDKEAKAAKSSKASNAASAPAAQPVRRTCPECGNVDVSGAEFCPACDADMDPGTPPV